MKYSVLFTLFIGVLIFSGCEKLEVLSEKGHGKECKKEKKDIDESCFDLVFPVTYIMPDDSTISGNKVELEVAMKDWYLANSDSDGKPTLQYPVDIVFEDGVTQTINDVDEMILIKKDCYDSKEN